MTEERARYNANQPDDVLVKQVGNLCFYFSKQEHKLYVETTDYGTGREALSRADIIDLLRIIDGQAGEKEQELMTEMEQDDDDF